MVDGASFFHTVKRGKLGIFRALLYNINKAIESKDLKQRSMEEIVPEQYHKFLPVFSKVQTDQLPPYRPGIDHDLRFNEGETPLSRPLVLMSRAELVVLTEWLEENMSKGCIWQSLSPFTAHVLLAKKPDGGLRFCIHCWDVNKKRIKNQCSHPGMKGTRKPFWESQDIFEAGCARGL